MYVDASNWGHIFDWRKCPIKAFLCSEDLYLLLLLFGLIYKCLNGAIPSSTYSIKAPKKWRKSAYDLKEIYHQRIKWLRPLFSCYYYILFVLFNSGFSTIPGWNAYMLKQHHIKSCCCDPHVISDTSIQFLYYYLFCSYVSH